MSGEQSKVKGDIGELGAKKFIDYLGWNRLTDHGIQYSCEMNDHRTASEKDKKDHGIDLVYAYDCPYRATERVILVESKSINWNAGGKLRSSETGAKQISGFIKVLHQKICCARSSDHFIKLSGASENADYVGSLFYYASDKSYSEAHLQECLEGVTYHRDTHSTDIFFLSNTQIDNLYSMFRHIEIQTGEHKRRHYYCNFKLDQYPDKGGQSTFLTLESMYSKFIFAKVELEDGTYANNIYYFGDYEPNSIRMFCSALYRFQLHLMDNLSFYPVSMLKTQDNMHGITNYFHNNMLVINDRRVSISLKHIDKLNYIAE